MERCLLPCVCVRHFCYLCLNYRTTQAGNRVIQTRKTPIYMRINIHSAWEKVLLEVVEIREKVAIKWGEKYKNQVLYSSSQMLCTKEMNIYQRESSCYYMFKSRICVQGRRIHFLVWEFKGRGEVICCAEGGISHGCAVSIANFQDGRRKGATVEPPIRSQIMKESPQPSALVYSAPWLTSWAGLNVLTSALGRSATVLRGSPR